jgi:uncharacterized membrane protein
MVISKAGWLLRRTLRETWVRVVLQAVLALALVLLAQVFGPLIPERWHGRIGAEAVDQVLTILASSMLAVTTFSLSVAVSAFTAAAQSATPRAAVLLQEDRTTQNVLATSLGTFLFSLVGVIALNGGYYDGAGRMLLFVATLGVIAAVVTALLRWIGHLMRFGRMGDTLDRVEEAANGALRSWLEEPFLRCAARDPSAATGPYPIRAEAAGSVQHVDIVRLAEIAGESGTRLHLAALPGAFVPPASALAWSEAPLSDEDEACVRRAFTLGAHRSFDQDPRFGLVVVTEIASRALSPAVNDPGTAISVIGRLVRVLAAWREPADPDPAFGRITVPPIRAADLIEDALRPIARDGAGLIEVQVRLQKALAGLAEAAPAVFAAPAVAMAHEALARAEAAPLLEAEKRRLAALVAEWTASHAGAGGARMV